VSAGRPFSLVRSTDQWCRCSHERTTVDVLTSVVSLAELPAPRPPTVGSPASAPPVGFAVDAACRVFRSVSEEHRLERWLWASRELPPRDVLAPSPPMLFLEPPRPDPAAPVVPPGLWWRPLGLAVDCGQRLFVSQEGRSDVLVYELGDGRLRRRIALGDTPATGPRLLDLAAHGGAVWGVAQGPARLVKLTADGQPVELPLPAAVKAPSRLAVSDAGSLVVLDERGTATARLHWLSEAGELLASGDAVPFASDVEFLELDQGREVFVVAGPGETVAGVFQGRAFFRRVLREGAAMTFLPEQLRAPGYDGRGIFRAPPDAAGARAIAYLGAGALRQAGEARLRYERAGRVAVFALDAGDYQTRWGRLFLDACVPEGTQVQVRCLALDEVPEDVAPWPWAAPAGVAAGTVHAPELTPPLPPRALLEARPAQWLYQRERGQERGWDAATAATAFATFEAPVRAEPGRYLWVLVELSGTGQATPRVRALRVERPGHDLLRRLPRVYSKDAAAADFLQRYLAPLEGLLAQLDDRAAMREVLVSPDATPAELLPWLASFVGLVMDRRWPVPVQRTFVREAAALFRRRGTLGSLQRMLEIVLGVRPVIVEHFRLRGLGGVQLGGTATAVVGAGLRVGGSLGEPASELPGAGEDAFLTHAHRFSVFVPAWLDESALDQARFILDNHRPAHTLYELCTLAGGMRVGLRLHLGLTAFVGPGGGFTEAQLGQTRLDRAVLAPAGLTGRLGGVRVGSAEVQRP